MFPEGLSVFTLRLHIEPESCWSGGSWSSRASTSWLGGWSWRSSSHRAGEYAVLFLESLSSEYVGKLKDRAVWVVERFQGMSDQELDDYMRSRWSQWGAEFVWNSLFDAGE